MTASSLLRPTSETSLRDSCLKIRLRKLILNFGLLITNSLLVVFTYLLHVHFFFLFSHYFLTVVYHPAMAAIPKNKPFKKITVILYTVAFCQLFIRDMMMIAV